MPPISREMIDGDVARYIAFWLALDNAYWAVTSEGARQTRDPNFTFLGPQASEGSSWQLPIASTSESGTSLLDGVRLAHSALARSTRRCSRSENRSVRWLGGRLLSISSLATSRPSA
jgi:hypothetical protein